MTVSNANFLKGMYTATRLMGDKSISSDATLEIEGHADLLFLTKQFPWPTLATAGEIEVATPLGAAAWQPQQLKVNQQGQLALVETTGGRVQRFLEDIIAKGGRFNATVYEGTPERFYRALKISDCFFQSENPDRDWENRSQVTLITGTLFFHFFGETLPSNIVI